MTMCFSHFQSTEIETSYQSLTKDDRVWVIVPLSSNVFSKVYVIIETPFGIRLLSDHIGFHYESVFPNIRRLDE